MAQADIQSFTSTANKSLAVCQRYYTPEEEKLARTALAEMSRLTAAEAKALHTSQRDLIDRVADDAMYHAHNDSSRELAALRFETLLKLDEIAYGKNAPQLVWALNRLGIFRRSMFANNPHDKANFQKAEQLLLRAQSLMQSAKEEDTIEYQLNLLERLRLHQSENSPAVERMVQQLLKTHDKFKGAQFKNQYGKDKLTAQVYDKSFTRFPSKGELYNSLAWAQRKQGKFADAAKNYRLALAQLKADGEHVGTVQSDLMEMFVEQKMFSEAESVARAAASDAKDSNYLHNRTQLANVLVKSGKFAAAIPIYEDVRNQTETLVKNAKPRGYESQAPDEPWSIPATLFVESSEGLADCYVKQKNITAAENALKHALDVCNAFKLKSKLPFSNFGPNSQAAKQLQSKLDALKKKS